MIEVTMADKPGGRAHEIPGMCTEVKSKLEFGNSPIGLNCRARVPLDGQPIEIKVLYGGAVKHARRQSQSDVTDLWQSLHYQFCIRLEVEMISSLRFRCIK